MSKPNKDIQDDDHPRDIVKPKTLEDKYADALATIRRYESNSPMKAVYAINRKVSEMADLLNTHNLSEMRLSDKDDKTFDRIRVVGKDIHEWAMALKELTKATGATGKEESDLSLPFIERQSESRQ